MNPQRRGLEREAQKGTHAWAPEMTLHFAYAVGKMAFHLLPFFSLIYTSANHIDQQSNKRLPLFISGFFRMQTSGWCCQSSLQSSFKATSATIATDITTNTFIPCVIVSLIHFA